MLGLAQKTSLAISSGDLREIGFINMKAVVLILALAAPSAVLSIGDYVNLCDEYGTYCCFDGGDGSTDPTYWFIETQDDPNDHRLNCLLDTGTSRLALLDSYAKVACAVRYIKDEYNTNGDERTYAFGLASSTQGVWEWENTISGEISAAEYQHWAPSEPDGGTGDLCVAMTVGEDYHLSGFWEDVGCSDAGVYAICEFYQP